MHAISSAIAVVVAMAMPAAFAQQFVYPAKGQNAQQQKIRFRWSTSLWAASANP
jgi:hypothetical protein